MRYWGIHHGIPESDARPERRQNRVYREVPYDERMRRCDVACLFDGNTCLYGWGVIIELGEPYEKQNALYHDVTVSQSFLQYQLRRVAEIKQNSIFSNYESIQEKGTVTAFSENQAQYLRGVFPANANPPDPAAVREEAAKAAGLRPVENEFVLGERLRIEETLFDEFKTITSGNVVKTILDTVEKYAIGFLNIENRQGEDHCRIFWGIGDNRVVVGIKVTEGQRDAIRQDVNNRLRRIQPPIAPSSFPMKFHEVKDGSGAAREDLYVLEVAVGKGEDHELYCSGSGNFYIKQEGVNPNLNGQSLFAEIRRRVRNM